MNLKRPLRNAASPPHHPDHEQTDLKEDDRGDGEKTLCHDVRRRSKDGRKDEGEEDHILSPFRERCRGDEAGLSHGDEDERKIAHEAEGEDHEENEFQIVLHRKERLEVISAKSHEEVKALRHDEEIRKGESGEKEDHGKRHEDAAP